MLIIYLFQSERYTLYQENVEALLKVSILILFE